MKKQILILLFGLGTLLLASASFLMYLWFRACAQYDSFEETKQAYLDNFPASLQDATITTGITILLLSGSLVCFIKAISANFLKPAAVVLVVISGLLLSWNIFSLM